MSEKVVVEEKDGYFSVREDKKYYSAFSITALAGEEPTYDLLCWESNGAGVGLTITRAELQRIKNWLDEELE